ncbi:hypothetical protein ACVGW3_00140, partial [Enterobacter hormaechei]
GRSGGLTPPLTPTARVKTGFPYTAGVGEKRFEKPGIGRLALTNFTVSYKKMNLPPKHNNSNYRWGADK